MGHVYQRVKFAAVNEEPLLGVEAVEALGLAVDPTTPPEPTRFVSAGSGRTEFAAHPPARRLDSRG
jgi:hypothetical protein